MGNFTGKLAPGETNFIASKPLTQAEADLLYFPIDGDLGTSQIGVSMTQVSDAISNAIISYELLSLSQGDERYMSIDTPFDSLFTQLNTQFQAWINQSQAQIDGMGEGLATTLRAEIDIHRTENPAHTWEQISGKPETATRWPGWLEVSDKPDFDALYRQLRVAIDWSEIANIPPLATDWDSISGKPDFNALYRAIGTAIEWNELNGIPLTFAPSSHAHSWSDILDPPTTATRWADWSEVTGKPNFDLLYRQTGVAIDWSEISNPPTFSADWNSITEKPSTYPPSTHGHDWNDITGIPPENGGTITYNIINSSPAFVEEFDDFLQNAAAGKLGWTTGNQNGYSFTVPGNDFPGAKGVFGCGIRGTNQVVGDYSRNRLGNFPIIPQLSEGYQNLEIQSVIAIENVAQSSVEWSSRFGLIDGAHSNIDGSNWSILICAEFFEGAYNWIALWKSGNNNATQKRLITPVVTSSTEMFKLAIFIDCQTYQIKFSVNATTLTVDIPAGDWGFGAMAPVFQVQRQGITASTANRRMWGDKFLIRENVSDAEVPTGPTEVDWVDVLNKPLIFPPENHGHDWGEIAAIPATASRWPTWMEISDRPDIPLDTGDINLSLIAPWYTESEGAVYRKVGKRVYLEGVVSRDVAGSMAIGVLPSGYRPIRRFQVRVYLAIANYLTTAFLEVTTDGSIAIVGSVSSDIYGVPLGVVSFFVP